MLGGLVERHDGMFIRRKFSRKTIEKVLHGLFVGMRHHPGMGVITADTHGCKEIGKGKAIVAFTGRTFAAPPPAMCHPAFLSDAGFVLKPERDVLIFVCVSNRLELFTEPP